jgi:MraZ protein
VRTPEGLTVLYGEHLHSLDIKNRVVVPRKFQEQLTRNEAGAMVAYLAAGQDGCLYLFSEAGFERAQHELESRVFAGQAQRAVLRLFFANTARVELDAAGRVLLPEKLKKHAGIDKDVVVVGVKDRAEIWAKETWETYELRNQDLLQHIDEVLRDAPGGAAPAG